MNVGNSGGTPLVQGRFVRPEVVSTHFHLKEGDVVADFGAGSGYFIDVLAHAVGGEGRVYACEIQKNLVEKLGDVIRQKNLSNVDALWCDLEEVGGSTLRDEALDVVVLVNTLFQMEDKETAMTEIKRVLRRGGVLFVIDWTESFGGLGPQPGQVYSEADARALIEAAGFTYERSYDAGDHHYGLAFKK